MGKTDEHHNDLYKEVRELINNRTLLWEVSERDAMEITLEVLDELSSEYLMRFDELNDEEEAEEDGRNG